MAEAICSNHGKVEAVWKEGTSKAGKQFAFWACPVKGKDPKTGDWWKCKVEVANTPSGKFDQSLDKAAAQMDNTKKDELITRTAIAKSIIERGDRWSMEVAKEAEAWFAWVKGRNTLTAALNKPNEPHVDDGDIPLDEIPF